MVGKAWSAALMVLFVLLTQRMSVSTDVVDANGAADDILNGNGDISLSAMLAENEEDIEEDEAVEEGWGGRRKGPCSRNWVMIRRDLLKPDCLATPKMLAGVRRMVKFVGSETHPEWSIQSGCRDRKGKRWDFIGSGPIKRCKREDGRVQCPCATAKGRRLTSNQAYQRILGQLTNFPVRARDVYNLKFERLKAGIATTRMVECWKNRCAAEPSKAMGYVSMKTRTGIGNKLRQQGLDELLDITEEATAGWDCG